MLYCTGLAQIPLQQCQAVKYRRKKPTESSIFSPLFVAVCILLFTLMLCWTFCLFGRPSCSPTQESCRRCCVCHSEKKSPNDLFTSASLVSHASADWFLALQWQGFDSRWIIIPPNSKVTAFHEYNPSCEVLGGGGLSPLFFSAEPEGVGQDRQ